jgi:hypothetical protein
MSRRSGNRYITGWKAFALLPVAVPVILFLKLFGIGQSTDRSANEVAGFIRDFIEGTGGEWDWDDFICVPIKAPELDSIRRRSFHGRATPQPKPVSTNRRGSW